MDWSDCPLVESVPDKVSGAPILRGTRMPADAIVENYLSGLRADEIAKVFQLPADSVRDLLVYATASLPALRA